MKSRLVTFVIAFVVWMLLSFSFDVQHWAVGAAVALLTAVVIGDLFTSFPHKWAQPKRYLWFVYFLLVFLWECVKANIDVATRVLHPHLPIRPGIVRIKTTLKSETALTMLANFITLTPGTLTVDIDRERGILYIHWIDVVSQDVEEASRRITAWSERILGEVFE